MRKILLRATLLWLLLLAAAILNAALREGMLNPRLGESAALPLSGILLSVLIFGVALLTVPFLRISRSPHYWLVGAYWVALTLGFDILLGRYLQGRSWHEILEIFDLRGGNLMSLVLVVTLLAPRAAARLRGLPTGKSPA